MRNGTKSPVSILEADRPWQGGATPLHLASSKGLFGVAAMLIEGGADVNATVGVSKGGETPLHEAAWQGHAEVVALLLVCIAHPLF